MQWIDFNRGWTCRRLDGSNDPLPVTLPHDAMLEEKRTPTVSGGRDTGWFECFDQLYEKRFVPDEAWRGKELLLAFDGVSGSAEVLLNGEHIASCGLTLQPFGVSLTGRLRIGEVNILRVEVRADANAGIRWYTGLGICRDVRLWYGGDGYILRNGVRFRTLQLDQPQLAVEVLTDRPGRLGITILDGERVMAADSVATEGCTVLTMRLPGALLWQPEHPQLYTCRLTFGRDTVTRAFGLCTVGLDETGFLLNGERFTLYGACLVQNDGILGAKEYPESARRRARVLRQCGYNAVLPSGAPCSEAFLDACDREGLLVIDELAGHWFNPGEPVETVLRFREKALEGLRQMAGRDRAHPCLAMYSIGSGVPESAYARGVELAASLTEALRREDPGRPVLCGVSPVMNRRVMNRPDKNVTPKPDEAPTLYQLLIARGDRLLTEAHPPILLKPRAAKMRRCDSATRGVWARVDVAGYRFAEGRIAHDLKKYPGRLCLVTETRAWDSLALYDRARRTPGIPGCFTWAGIDYLGETALGAWEYPEYAPVPNGPGWIAAGVGAADLCGRPGGEALCASVVTGRERGPLMAVVPVMRETKHTVSPWRYSNALPYWSWSCPEKTPAEVEVYDIRAARIRLLLNDEKLDERPATPPLTRFHVRWMPGTLTAVSLDRKGRELGRCSLASARGGPRLTLEAEPYDPGDRLLFVRVRFTDENGVTLPNERRRVSLWTGGGTLTGFGSGCPYNELSCLDDKSDTYYGEALAAILREGDGPVRVTAGDGRFTAELTLP